MLSVLVHQVYIADHEFAVTDDIRVHKAPLRRCDRYVHIHVTIIAVRIDPHRIEDANHFKRHPVDQEFFADGIGICKQGVLQLCAEQRDARSTVDVPLGNITAVNDASVPDVFAIRTES